MRVYYFGCDGQAGHYMHLPNMLTDWKFLDSNPWGWKIDYEILKGREGQYVLTHKDGWTALSFHDYTVDQRPGSNSSFLAEGEYTRDQMFGIAWEHFPSIAKRVSLPSAPRKEGRS